VIRYTKNSERFKLKATNVVLQKVKHIFNVSQKIKINGKFKIKT